MKTIIADRRTHLNYTQEEISRKLDISTRHYQNIESMKVNPSVNIALKLCLILRIDPYEIWEL